VVDVQRLRPTATDVTTLLIERFDVPSTARGLSLFDSICRAAAEELGGRTVWCAAALPSARAPAAVLRASLQRETGGEAVTVGSLDVPADDALRDLAERVETMLSGGREADQAAQAPLGPGQEELYAEGIESGESFVGEWVRPDDVVVLHDALSATLAQAVRERGAHAIWRVPPPSPAAGAARAFLRPYTTGLDAYVTTDDSPDGRRFVALMPSADLLAAWDVPPGGDLDSAGWSSILAEVVHADRDEHVGGRRHPRPTVAAR
jgi:hypothetical protein